jgi:fido (protein-threonine AMPylation protein)
MEQSSKSPHIWVQLKSLGLYPEITSLDEYEVAVAEGSLTVTRWFSGELPDLFKASTIQMAHWLLFRRVHPWAGEFRRAGEMSIVAGYPGAEHWRIGREFDLLATQLFSWPDLRDLTQGEQLAIKAAFSHVRFERIHPFRDGNGRVGRILLTEYLSRGGVPSNMHAVARDSYFAALKDGNRSILSPLASVITGLEIKPEVRSPYRVAPRMFEEATEVSLDDDLQWSRSKATSKY